MNIFVLSTGRCGSVTFASACEHIENYSVGHESNWNKTGEARLEYPDNHIEIDNRLSWFTGRLEKKYGDKAYYVHLLRNRTKTAKSYNERWIGSPSIIKAYSEDILVSESKGLEECLDYYDTVNSNIELFLKDKVNKIRVEIENVEINIENFWKDINAKGDYSSFIDTFSKKHNKSDYTEPNIYKYYRLAVRNIKKYLKQ